MKKSTCLAVMALSMVACSDSDSVTDPSEPPSAFVYRGLEGSTIVDLVQTENTLVAATESGIYKYTGNEDWALVTPQDWDVLAVVPLYPSHLLASVQLSADEFRLAESLNSGDDWSIVENDFGGVAGVQTEPMLELAFDEASGELFATGYDVLARSDDFGRSWSVYDGDWQRTATGMSALAIAIQHGDIWFGGQDAIENASLRHTDRSTGESTDLSEAIQELLVRPSTVKSVVFYPNAETTVFVGGEGGVVRSNDYGTSWSPILTNDTSRFYFDLLVDDETGMIYTGGWDKNYVDPQRLVLEVSDDSGITWRAFEHTDSDIRGGIWSLLIARLDNEKRLFVGLQGGGVYEVELDRLND